MEKLTQEQKNLLADAIADLHTRIAQLKNDKKTQAAGYTDLIKDKNKLLNKCVIAMLSNSVQDEEVLNLMASKDNR